MELTCRYARPPTVIYCRGAKVLWEAALFFKKAGLTIIPDLAYIPWLL